MGSQQEVKELEERNRGLQHDLELVKAGEQEAARTRESLERQRAVLREEVAAATSRLERATQIRNTCKRLSNLEGKLNPLGGQPGATARQRRARVRAELGTGVPSRPAAVVRSFTRDAGSDPRAPGLCAGHGAPTLARWRQSQC